MEEDTQPEFPDQEVVMVDEAFNQGFPPPPPPRLIPFKIRIGPEHHRYVYTRWTNTAYKCEKGSDYAPPGTDTFLWLSLQATGEWIAYDGLDPGDGTIPPVVDPIFTSYEDIVVAGQHKWRMRKWKDGTSESKFMTTMLMP